VAGTDDEAVMRRRSPSMKWGEGAGASPPVSVGEYPVFVFPGSLFFSANRLHSLISFLNPLSAASCLV
jgi:hypothetical protein